MKHTFMGVLCIRNFNELRGFWGIMIYLVEKMSIYQITLLQMTFLHGNL